jgi:2-oxoglutarate dehydrogenase E2 component (dihydrolipoamide succinyltransferase)
MKIKVPTFPESVTEGVLIAWNKQVNDQVQVGDIVAEIETDKVVFEVPAPSDGTIKELLIKVDDSVESEQAIAVLEEGEVNLSVSEAAPTEEANTEVTPAASKPSADAPAGVAARKIMGEKNLSRDEVTGTGKGGRITKFDALNAAANSASSIESSVEGLEQRVPMSNIRKRIAERLLQSSQSTAMLTTFNEVNMQPIMDARAQYKELFEKQNGVRLGFMSFFIKAATQALLRHPDVNASIDGSDIVYHGYCDVGVAVSTERGLVVPIIRQAENLSFAEIEGTINQYAIQARENKLSIDDLIGGTFSITNGGVFGSLMSTPIINPPQSAILGMHAIKQRPIAENGQVVIRPMMYLALSYDHRIIDGKTSVTFLRNLKEMLEDPVRLVMNI